MELLIIEQGRETVDWLGARLEGDGFLLRHADTSAQAIVDGSAEASAAVIYAPSTTQIQLVDQVQGLRKAGIDQPLLVLSAHGNWRERVACLDCGADDFLTKPVRAEEVAARLRAIIRRNAGSSQNRLEAGPLAIELKSRRAFLDNCELDLTRTELRLLRLFLLRPEQILAQREISEVLYPDKPQTSANAIEVQIARLRRKIGKRWIKTIRGVGYVFGREIPQGEPAVEVPPKANDEIGNGWSPQI